jgi:hypothetical protein
MKGFIRDIINKKTEFKINWCDLSKHTKPQLQTICKLLKLDFLPTDKKEQLILKIKTKA